MKDFFINFFLFFWDIRYCVVFNVININSVLFVKRINVSWESFFRCKFLNLNCYFYCILIKNLLYWLIIYID